MFSSTPDRTSSTLESSCGGLSVYKVLWSVTLYFPVGSYWVEWWGKVCCRNGNLMFRELSVNLASTIGSVRSLKIEDGHSSLLEPGLSLPCVKSHMEGCWWREQVEKVQPHVWPCSSESDGKQHSSVCRQTTIIYSPLWRQVLLPSSYGGSTSALPEPDAAPLNRVAAIILMERSIFRKRFNLLLQENSTKPTPLLQVHCCGRGMQTCRPTQLQWRFWQTDGW